MKKIIKGASTLALALLLLLLPSCSNRTKELEKKIDRLTSLIEDFEHNHDVVLKNIDDVQLRLMLEDIAHIDKVRLTGPPRWKPKKEGDRFAANPLRFFSYIFIPKDAKEGQKYPLIVLPHGGVHSNFKTNYFGHIVRELVAQGYIVVSADYRGSRGYGKSVYQNIDYGGLEYDDVLASRDYMVESYSIVDESRVGIVGWSHGGMISLMNILHYPSKYQVAFAGVPVSDLASRLTSHDERYNRFFTADYHIGESLEENPEEYKRRSPSNYAHKLETPLLIYTNTIDDDVYVEEVIVMIDSLKAHNKEFQYKIFEDIPGGHSFDIMDTNQGSEFRYSMYKFIEKYLNPPHPFTSFQELRKASYRFKTK